MAKRIRQPKIKGILEINQKRTLLIEIQYVDLNEALQVLHRSICSRVVPIIQLKTKCTNTYLMVPFLTCDMV